MCALCGWVCCGGNTLLLFIIIFCLALVIWVQLSLCCCLFGGSVVWMGNSYYKPSVIKWLSVQLYNLISACYRSWVPTAGADSWCWCFFHECGLVCVCVCVRERERERVTGISEGCFADCALLPSLGSCTLILGGPWYNDGQPGLSCEVWNWVVICDLFLRSGEWGLHSALTGIHPLHITLKWWNYGVMYFLKTIIRHIIKHRHW